MKGLVLDTHAVVWYLMGSKQLSARAGNSIQKIRTAVKMNFPLVTRDVVIQRANIEVIW